MAKPQRLFLSTFGLSFVVYVNTLAPSITWRNDGADSGDLAAAAAVGGIPHPSGYPTYLILGDIFKRLPFGDIAYRLNLLSATCAALTVALMGLTVYQTLSQAVFHQSRPEKEGNGQVLPRFCAIVAALMLAFSPLFWSQAVIAEVYALNALFAAVLLYGSIQVSPANQKWLAPVLVGLFGLSLGNHLSILLLLPLFIWILRLRWNCQLIATSLLAFCSGLSIYLIIPWRATALPPVNWGLGTTWPNFWWLVSAEAYRHFLFALPWQFVPGRLLAQLYLFSESFWWWGLPLGLLGFQQLTRFHSLLAYSSLAALLTISVYSVGYNTTDSYLYLLPALLIFSLWLGWGFHVFGSFIQRLATPNFAGASLVGWGVILLPLLSLWFNYSEQDLSQDNEASIYARQSLQSVASDAVIIADSDPLTFALWYGRYGLEMRPDVAIVNSNLLSYEWYRQSLGYTHPDLLLSGPTGNSLTTLSTFVEQNFPRSPIYLATSQPGELAGRRVKACGNLQRVMSPR